MPRTRRWYAVLPLFLAWPLLAQEAVPDPEATPLDEVVVQPWFDPFNDADRRLRELKRDALPGLGGEAVKARPGAAETFFRWAFVPVEPPYLGPVSDPLRRADDLRREAELRNAGRDDLP